MGEHATERPRRVRKGPDERREQILACARRLFGERPYEAVSTAEIAAAAGVSRGLLHHYFGTRRELYVAAVERMVEIPPVPVPAFDAGATVRDRIERSLDAWLELLHRNRTAWVRALDLTASGGDADLERVLDAARGRAVDHLTEVVGLAPLAAAHPEVRAAFRGYSGMAEAAAREWLKHGRLTRAQTRTLLRDVLLHLVEDVVPALAAPDAAL
ncbi:TetR/AcrR family transcriptional regulator [Actinomadura atramentaria]|uniref:TetR/AcrR family transcriptional regulator n=1 Tax=Actinomadura atramentaria TaxID=1990 RepID=UPI00036ACE4E|nr:TetR/AcrR family transcriptional regulator [Actinomadura atramentaria]